MAERARKVEAVAAVDDTPTPDRRRRWLGAGLLVVVLAAGTAAGLHWYHELRFWESTDDAFAEGTLLMIAPRVGGSVAEVAVAENQHVRAGQLLVQLDPGDLEVRVAHARAEVDTAHNQMAAARAAVEAADAERQVAVVELEHATSEAKRVQDLHERGAASDQALENAVSARDAAAARVRALEERVRSERAVLGNEAPVRLAEANLREAERLLSYTTISAPADGVVGRKSVTEGETVAVGQPLLAFVTDDAPHVTANFKETQVGHMRVGDPAEIRFDAFSDRVWKGHVESLAPATGARYALLPPDNATGNFTKVVQRVPVRIALEDGANAPPLALGLSAEVRVRVASR